MWTCTDKSDGTTTTVTEARVKHALEGAFKPHYIAELMEQAKQEGIPLLTSFAIYRWVKEA